MNRVLAEISSIQDVAELVEKDQSLTAKVLTVANSALYGRPKAVSTVKDAIVTLGFNKLKSIVLSISLMDTLAFLENSNLDIKEFWRHSLSCAVLSQDISEKLGFDFSDEVFVAGLLHDVGKLILDVQVPEKFGAALELSIKERIDSSEAERRIIGVGHGLVGKWIMEKWRFPDHLIGVAWLHHTPPDLDTKKNGREQLMISLVALADNVSNACSGKIWTVGSFDKIEKLKDRFKMSEDDLKEITSKATEKVEEIAQILGRDIGSSQDIFTLVQRANQELSRMSLDLDHSYRKLQEAQEQIVRMERLNVLGHVATGIAHDFNNVLATILVNVSLAKYAKSEDEISEVLTTIEKVSIKARDLTQQLLTFSSGGAPIKETISISELIKDSVGFALRGSNVKCEFSMPDDLWAVEVDEGQISQVINNLIINADQAMPEGSTIKMRAENVTVGAKNSLPLQEGKYIKICVEDQGIGISQEHLDKIFDPFFTTKQEGSGLGLTTSYSIITNHDGYISVESELGVGTTFHIYLPATSKEIQIKEDIEDRPLAGKGKILIMDDEEDIRESLSQILTHFGYEAQFAEDGAAAIKLYKQAQKSGQPFDAVIMDLTVPGGIGGKEAIRKLLEIDPEVKAIVSSGYSNDPVLANFRQYGFSSFVAKPYKVEELSKTLREVIMGTSEQSCR